MPEEPETPPPQTLPVGFITSAEEVFTPRLYRVRHLTTEAPGSTLSAGGAAGATLQVD